MNIAPSAIEQLNHAECYPIVVYFRVSDRRIVKQIRQQYGKLYQKSSRRLLETSEYLEHFYSYLFTSIIQVQSADEWYDTLKRQIDLQQEQPLWMNYDQSIDPDFLQSDDYFVSTRSSYVDEFIHSDKSARDFDTLSRQRRSPLQRVASDPAVFPNASLNRSISTTFSHEVDEDDTRRFIPLPNRCHSVIEMPTDETGRQSTSLFPSTPLLYQRTMSHPTAHTSYDKPGNVGRSLTPAFNEILSAF